MRKYIKANSAYTMIEIIITMIIAISLMGLGVFTMSSYMPKQRLLDSLETVEQTMSRAQLEATSRSTWSCIIHDATTNSLVIYMDNSNDHTTGNLNACGNGTDLKISSQQLHQGVTFPSGCGFNFSSAPMWFDTAGVPKLCVTGGAGCSAQTFQAIVTNPKLPSGNCAREVEDVSSELIKIVPRGEKGYDTSVVARTPALTDSGNCEGSCTTP